MPVEASRRKGLSCAPRWVMLEYDRLQRAGELLQATEDEFLGTSAAPSATGSSESNVNSLYIVAV